MTTTTTQSGPFAAVAGRPGARRGMTLMELLVAVAVMATMIAAVGTVLTQTRKLVTSAQGTMRANQQAAAIAHLIRTDLASASQNGFLCVATASDGSPRLILTTAGVTHSVTSTASGMGAFVCYGLVGNSGDASRPILWRPALVLTGAASRQNDCWDTDLASLQVWSRTQINTNVVDDIVLGDLDGNGSADANPSVPATSLSQINDLWKVLVDGCSDLKITWTDGTKTDATLNWYGKDNPKGDGAIESGPATSYRALWTNKNQTNWPKAIRVQFTLTDRALPAEFQTLAYEVIAPVAQ